MSRLQNNTPFFILTFTFFCMYVGVCVGGRETEGGCMAHYTSMQRRCDSVRPRVISANCDNRRRTMHLQVNWLTECVTWCIMPHLRDVWSRQLFHAFYSDLSSTRGHGRKAQACFRNTLAVHYSKKLWKDIAGKRFEREHKTNLSSTQSAG